MQVNGQIAVRHGSLEPEAPAEPRSRVWERWAVKLTSPTSVLLSVPLSAFAVGSALVVLSYQRFVALDERATLERADLRRDQAELALKRSLATADPLLDRVREVARSVANNRIETLASSLADLAVQREGLTWLSLSFPDGSFRGVFRDADGSMCFQESHLVDGQTRMHQYSLRGGALAPKAEASFHYDPRERAFYRLALERRQRAWTQPYTFYPDFRTGITRTEPVFDAQGSLRAVITADYDVSELSQILSRATHARESLVLFTDDGVVLGVSGLKKDPRTKADERPLAFADLGRADLLSFYRSRGRAEAGSLREFSAGDTRYLASEHPLRAVDGLKWRLALILPKDSVTATARAHARRELWLAAAVVLLAVGLACGLSIGIQRLRTARARAEARSERVMGKLRELGAYTLEEQLGTGGMGEVFRARHRMLARPAAIKLIRTDIPKAEREALEARFDIEAKVLSELRSPHTVTILDYGRTTDDRLFIVMELLVGLPLDKLVEKHGPQPAARVIPILIGVCRSLAEAHAAGIVHRDIKPANLFLCHDAEGVELVKVLDFGLAKSTRKPGLTSEGHVAGTPHFMPPEQALGHEVDERADLYALGCTAHYLLTGKTVFDEPSDIAVILAHQMKPPPPLTEHTSAWLPDGLEVLVQRCLAKDRAFRPASAAALARAFSALTIPEDQSLGAETWRNWWLRFENLPGAVSSPPSRDFARAAIANPTE